MPPNGSDQNKNNRCLINSTCPQVPNLFLSNSVDLLVCMALASAKQTRFSLKLKMIFHTYSKIVFKAGRKRKINATHTLPQCRKIPKKCHLWQFWREHSNITYRWLGVVISWSVVTASTWWVSWSSWFTNANSANSAAILFHILTNETFFSPFVEYCVGCVSNV